MKRAAVVLVEARATRAGELDALRRRLGRARAATHDAIVVDALEDDLAESRRALRSVGDFVSRVEEALRDPGAARQRLLALAGQLGPARDLEYLEANLGRLRRRIAQVCERLPELG